MASSSPPPNASPSIAATAGPSHLQKVVNVLASRLFIFQSEVIIWLSLWLFFVVQRCLDVASLCYLFCAAMF
jgi:hypothetical protein